MGVVVYEEFFDEWPRSFERISEAFFMIRSCCRGWVEG
jgi:hypothetical protein